MINTYDEYHIKRIQALKIINNYTKMWAETKGEKDIAHKIATGCTLGWDIDIGIFSDSTVRIRLNNGDYKTFNTVESYCEEVCNGVVSEILNERYKKALILQLAGIEDD